MLQGCYVECFGYSGLIVGKLGRFWDVGITLGNVVRKWGHCGNVVENIKGMLRDVARMRSVNGGCLGTL